MATKKLVGVTEAVADNLRVSFVLLAICLLSAGCSARVELERTNGSESTAAMTSSIEVDRTTVQLDFQPRRPQPTPPTEPPLNPVPPPVSPLTISGNTIILSYRGGDVIHHNQTHIHIHQSPPPRVEERIVIHTEPHRQVDEKCERLAREHEERVKRFRESPGTMGQ